MTNRASHPAPVYDLHIDELVLEGFSPSERRSLVAAMQRELTRLLSDPGAPIFKGPAGRAQNLALADAGIVTVGPGASPQKLGVEAARTIGRSLGALSSASGQGAANPGGRRR